MESKNKQTRLGKQTNKQKVRIHPPQKRIQETDLDQKDTLHYTFRNLIKAQNWKL